MNEPTPLVLFVDDNCDLQQMVGQGMKLYRPPFAAAFAGSVDEALRAVREITPAAVILDVNLTGETGMTVAEHLHEYFPHVAKAVLTAYDRTATHMSADEFEMEVWPKPILITELFDKVARLLAGHDHKDETAPGATALPPIVRALAVALGALSGTNLPRWH